MADGVSGATDPDAFTVLIDVDEAVSAQSLAL
jgi:hypothetical protein